MLRRAWSRLAVHHVLPIGVLATMLMWPLGGLTIGTGVDPGWVTSLQLARFHRLHFGPEFVFNYGPLGFAVFPGPIDRRALAACFVVIGVLATTYAVLSFRLMRIALPTTVAAVAGGAVLVLLAPSTGAALCEVVVIAAMATMVQLSLRPVPAALRWHVALGGLAGVLLVTKVSTGLVLGAGALVFALGRDERLRRLGLSAAAFVGTVVVLWLALGQRPTDLPEWLRGAEQISSGHSWAMGTEEPGRTWELWFLAGTVIALLVAGVVVAVRRHRADRPLASVGELAAVGIGALTLYFVFKEGFVRHDIHSGAFFFALMYFLATLVPWSRVGRWRPALATCWVVALLALNASGGNTLASALDAGPSATAFTHDIDALVDADAWQRAVDSARAQAVAAYAVPQEVLDAVASGTVHVDPYDPGPVWAYDLDWSPLPVATRYSAYTVDLDHRNAEVLGDVDGPLNVLRSAPEPLDGHLALLESPQTSVVMMCDFSQSIAAGGWQALQRRPGGSRCGEPRELATVEARPGVPIAVPSFDPANQALLIRMDFHLDLGERLRTFLYKADEYHLSVDGQPFRIVPTVVAEDGPLFVPASSGWDPGFLPFPDAPREIGVDHDATVVFSVVDVAAD